MGAWSQAAGQDGHLPIKPTTTMSSSAPKGSGELQQRPQAAPPSAAVRAAAPELPFDSAGGSFNGPFRELLAAAHDALHQRLHAHHAG